MRISKLFRSLGYLSAVVDSIVCTVIRGFPRAFYILHQLQKIEFSAIVLLVQDVVHTLAASPRLNTQRIQPQKDKKNAQHFLTFDVEISGTSSTNRPESGRQPLFHKDGAPTSHGGRRTTLISVGAARDEACDGSAAEGDADAEPLERQRACKPRPTRGAGCGFCPPSSSGRAACAASPVASQQLTLFTHALSLTHARARALSLPHTPIASAARLPPT